MRDYFNSIMKTVNRSIEGLDISRFELLVNDVVTTLKSGHKVILTGLGKNAPICEKIVGTMFSMGLDAVFLHTNTAIHGDMGVVHKGDIVLMLSKTGETAESVYLLKLLKQRDICLWTLTFKENSSLAVQNDKSLVIPLENEGDEWNIVPNNSTTVYLIILQALAIQTAKKMGVTLDDFRKNHPGGHIGVQLNGKL